MAYEIREVITMARSYYEALNMLSKVGDMLTEKMNGYSTGFIIRVGEVEEYFGSILLKGVFEVWVEGEPLEAVPYIMTLDIVSADRVLFYLKTTRDKEYMLYRIIAKALAKRGVIKEYSYRGGHLVLSKLVKKKEYLCIVEPDNMMIYVPEDGTVYGRIDVKALLDTGLFRRFPYDKTVLVPVMPEKKRYVETGLLGYKVYFGRALKMQLSRVVRGYYLYYTVRGDYMKGYRRMKIFVDTDNYEEARNTMLRLVVEEIKNKIEKAPKLEKRIIKDYVPVLKALGTSVETLKKLLGK